MSQLLRRAGHEVVGVAVGRCKNRVIPQFFIDKINCDVTLFDSPAMSYGNSGRSGSIWGTLLNNISPVHMIRWRASTDIIARLIEQSRADVVINFYELLMGVATIIHNIKITVITLAHQYIVNHPHYAHRSNSDMGQNLLRTNNAICRSGASKTLILSLYNLDTVKGSNLYCVPPLLREDIFNLTPQDDGYILGYMLNPNFLDEVVKWKRQNPDTEIHLFWDKKDAPAIVEHSKGLWLHRIDDVAFLEYMERCSGYITTAGFESICEAMYLGKPTLMIPAHLEQRINAIDAVGAGAGIMSEKFNVGELCDYIPRHNARTAEFREWVDSASEQFLKHLTAF